MKLKKILALGLAGIMGMSLLTGCTSASTSATTAKDSAAEGSSAENAGEKTIYVIVKVLGNQYWSVLQAGAEQAGKDLGCNVVVVGTALESDIEGQLTLLQNAVSAQADGIVIAPLDSVSLDAPIKHSKVRTSTKHPCFYFLFFIGNDRTVVHLGPRPGSSYHRPHGNPDVRILMFRKFHFPDILLQLRLGRHNLTAVNDRTSACRQNKINLMSADQLCSFLNFPVSRVWHNIGKFCYSFS